MFQHFSLDFQVLSFFFSLYFINTLFIRVFSIHVFYMNVMGKVKNEFLVGGFDMGTESLMYG